MSLSEYSILPGRPWRDWSIPYAHGSKPLDDDVAVHAIPIANDILWRLLPTVGFGQLSGNPMSVRACSHAQPQELAATMLQNQKSVQQPKGDRRNDEQIHRRNAVGMILQKSLPALRRRLSFPRHVFCHCSPSDIDAKLEQFAVDPRCSPKGIREAHVANELTYVRWRLWPATARLGFPAPIGSEPGTVPADHRLRLKNFQCVQYPRSQTVESRKHQPVQIAERHSLWGLAPQHVELVSKDKDLGFQRSPRPKQSSQGAPDQSAKVAHREAVLADSRSQSAAFGFAVGTVTGSYSACGKTARYVLSEPEAGDPLR